MEYSTTTFGERFAADYDSRNERTDTEACVDVLERLARGGPALELAIGTGRIGLPLSRRGLRVDGVEASPEMVEQLRKKPGGADIDVVIGDMAEVPVEGEYALIYLIFNTLSNLTTQDAQVRCFMNAARHLRDDGLFVLEAGVPDLRSLRDGQYVDAEAVDLDEVVLDVCRYDAVAQLMHKNHVAFRQGDVRLQPVLLRYTWPSEMDLMARLAGLRVHERWGDWYGTAFDERSTSNIVVYGR